MMQDWQKEQLKVATGVTDGSRKTPQTEALKLALDYLSDHQMGAHIVTAIKEALAQPEQEPTNLERHERNVQKFLGTQQPKEPEQEPVGALLLNGVFQTSEGFEFEEWDVEWNNKAVDALQEKLVTSEPVTLNLYTTPPQRTWVGLTAEELNMIGDRMRTWNSHSLADVYVAIEAKLKEKNT